MFLSATDWTGMKHGIASLGNHEMFVLPGSCEGEIGHLGAEEIAAQLFFEVVLK